MNQVETHLTTADLVSGGQSIAREESPGPLLPADHAQEMRSNWDQIQAGFVDEPRRAVEQADELVAKAIKDLAEGFANERARLERQWDRGEEVNTEDLRQALRKYRSFFQRLLTI